jgi:hypothetical protein
MAATHTFQGAGSVSGIGAIDASGDSLASLMANGNGGIKMAMAGGDVSALLIDLSGLEFGNAVLDASPATGRRLSSSTRIAAQGSSDHTMICLWTLGSKAIRCPELLLGGTVPRSQQRSAA